MIRWLNKLVAGGVSKLTKTSSGNFYEAINASENAISSSAVCKFLKNTANTDMSVILKPSISSREAFARKLEDAKDSSLITRLFMRTVYPPLFYLLIAPAQRYNMATLVKQLRQKGLMFDDTYESVFEINARAVELLPQDMVIERNRRIMRAQHLDFLKLNLTLEEQNYDPMIPYFAPYFEEAKFQLQEEEALLGYHILDRRLFSGGTSGLGEAEMGSACCVCFPYMYGYSIGNRHYSSRIIPKSMRGLLH